MQIKEQQLNTPAPGILWRGAAGGHVPSGEPNAPGGRLYRGWPKLWRPQKPAHQRTQAHANHCKVFTVLLLYVQNENDERAYLLLWGYGELVAGDKAGHLLHAQIKKLLTPDHLCKMLLCGHKLQINTAASLHNFINYTCSHSVSPDPPGHADSFK